MMNTTPEDDSLDQALTRALALPPLPAGFRTRLRAALTRVGDTDLATRRRLLEREHDEQMLRLQSDSVRLRWRTVGYLVGGAFAAGVGVAIACPGCAPPLVPRPNGFCCWPGSDSDWWWVR